MFDTVHSRREFLVYAAAVLSAAGAKSSAGFAQRPSRGALRVAQIVPSDSDPASISLDRGIGLGALEAQRTAMLFGFSMRVETLQADALASALSNAKASGNSFAAVVGETRRELCARISSIANAAGVIYLNAGCSDDRFRGKECTSTTYHVAASDAMRIDAVLDVLGADPTSRKARRRWIVVDSATTPTPITERISARLPSSGDSMERVSADALSTSSETFRDLNDRDVIVVARLSSQQREAAAAALSRSRSIIVDLGVAASRLRDGGGRPVRATEWHESLERFGAGQLNDRFRAMHGDMPIDGIAWSGWFAMKILGEAMLRTRQTDAASLMTFLSGGSTRFDGHKGVPLSFRTWDRQLRQPVYVVQTGSGNAEDSVQESPTAQRRGAEDSAARLDRIGESADESQCRRQS